MTLEETSRRLKTSPKILVTTHEAPDADGLGAEYALTVGLLETGKDVQILNSDPAGEKYTYIDTRSLFQTYRTDADLPKDVGERLLVIVDTVPNNIGSLSEILPNLAKEVIVIDHHDEVPDKGIDSLLVPDSSSTCELVYHILHGLEIPVNREMAVALYTGIVYDTGSFAYPKTKTETFRIAEDLVSRGVIPNDVYTNLFQSKSKGALILQSLVTSTMTLHLDDKVAVQVMPRDTLIASGADYEESQEIINIPLQCAGVRASVFFKEKENGNRRCSLRSKGVVNCVEIARSFGGGGHKTAAGFRFEETFADMQEKVLEAIRTYFP